MATQEPEPMSDEDYGAGPDVDGRIEKAYMGERDDEDDWPTTST